MKILYQIKCLYNTITSLFMMNLLTSRSTTGRHPCCRGVRRSRAVAGALFRSRRQGFYKRGCAFGLTQVGIGKALILHKDHKESKGMTWEAFFVIPS